MNSRLSLARSEFAAGLWAAEPSIDAHREPTDLDRFSSTRPSRGKRASRVLARFLITFCIGVAATLAWQSYGDALREIVANSSPQFAWVAPGVPVAQSLPAASGAPSPGQDQLTAISRGLAAVRQSVEQLAAGQQQMMREISKLQGTKPDALGRSSIPGPSPIDGPGRKPALSASPAR
jgi:hypothetical protein